MTNHDLYYGGVAALDVAEEVDRYAYRRGLFVLRKVVVKLVWFRYASNCRGYSTGTTIRP